MAAVDKQPEFFFFFFMGYEITHHCVVSTIDIPLQPSLNDVDSPALKEMEMAETRVYGAKQKGTYS